MPGTQDQDTAGSKRKGRGMLSSIEQLPELCDEHIAWANQELRERRMPQTEILREFNARIADHGCKPISKGAFSRYSVRTAIELRRAGAAVQITNAVMERLDKVARNDATVAAIELVKFRLMSLIMDEEETDIGLLNKASLTLQRLTSSQLRIGEAARRDDKDKRDQEKHDQVEAEKAKSEAIETADTVEKLATEAGLSAERVAAIRKGVLGLAG
ncbi:MAG: phage protein Gp27 family protein [Novosphingobium sp.]|uniref:phage protein Gp27 family protein n=1 Tax=Novosphingobium sp. TaxID=1874826 RepID=UPI0032B99933